MSEAGPENQAQVEATVETVHVSQNEESEWIWVAKDGVGDEVARSEKGLETRVMVLDEAGELYPNAEFHVEGKDGTYRPTHGTPENFRRA